MTADPHHTKPGPGEPLYGHESASTPVGGTPGGPNPLSGPQTGAQGFEREQAAPDTPLRDRLAALRQPPPDAPEVVTAPLDDLVAAVLGVRDEEVEQLRARIARVQNLRDKWLDYPADDVHYGAGLMLARYLSGDAHGSDGPQPAAHDGGPTVAECAEADRVWPLQREGE